MLVSVVLVWDSPSHSRALPPWLARRAELIHVPPYRDPMSAVVWDQQSCQAEGSGIMSTEVFAYRATFSAKGS